METPLLQTKLYIPPPRPALVTRSRLIERLNEGLPRKLALISAPAGFGKTTLVSSWLGQLAEGQGGRGAGGQNISSASLLPRSPAQVAWLSLDEGDNEPTRFLTYLIAALQTIAPSIGGGVLSLLQSPQPPPTETILTALLNDITTISDPPSSSSGSISGQGFILVLDDYHLIETQAVDQALTFLLDHLPPQLHLVIATREDPPLPLARYRVRGQLTELRATDLRFTPTEAADFLNQVMDLNLSAEEVTLLESRTEGWIAGLQLAALSMRGQQDAASFIQSFTGSHRFVMDYLLEEVLHRQPESVQTFLLRTSILDRMCGPLCDAVVGELEIRDGDAGRDTQTVDNLRRSQETLEYLEQANLFLVPLDHERRWYRYHHLFANLLRQRFQQNLSPSIGGKEGGSVADCHIRASQWYEQNDSLPEAIRHALAAEDFERVARLAELVWPAMDARFETDTWFGWVQALPDEMVYTRPVLSLGVAWAYLNGGDMEAGEAQLQDTERWLDPATTPAVEMVVVDEAQFQSLPASIATARAYIAQARGDAPATMKYARQALDLLPEADHRRRGPAAALLGLTQLANGNLEAAHRDLAEALANFRLTGNILFAISGIFVLADIRIAQGRLHEAIRTYEQALRLVAEQGEPALRGTADMVLGLGELYWEQGDREAATEHLLKSKDLGEQAAQAQYPYRRCLAQARIKEAQGDLAGALDRLDEAERLYIRSPIPDVRPLAALKARVWVRQGRLAEALAWAREQGLSVDDDLSYLQEFEHITLTRLLIAQYQRDRAERPIREAMELLERLLQAAEAGGRIGSVIEILILQALAHEAQGDITAALAPLERALSLAEPEGYVRIFVDEGAPMAGLLTQLPPTPYRDKILAAFSAAEERGSREAGEKISPPAPLPPRSPALIEPLSERELEILHLIAEGLSNREISQRLFLALSTVKGHNRIIFGKLQVQRRTEAVARARELGLL